MDIDAYTLGRLIQATIDALQNLPAKAKTEYATDHQLSEFNKHREMVSKLAPSMQQLIPPAFRLAAGTRSQVGNGRYADVVAGYAQLKVILDAIDVPPPPSVG